MARKSKLSESQWQEIVQRNIAGEPIRVLAREFGISEGAIRFAITAQVRNIKTVANQIVSVEREVAKLPIVAQQTARTLAYKMQAISSNLASAAEFNAATAHRIAGIANNAVQKLDDADPLSEGSFEALKTVAALTKISNDASYIGLELIKAANKNPEIITVDEENSAADMPVNSVDAARLYAQLMG
jgi:hypothetical protein